mgnify:CR=1 FL=1
MAPFVVADTGRSAFQQRQLVRLAFPFRRVGGRILAYADHRPAFRQFRVERDEAFLPGGYVVFRVDRIDRAFRFAQGAVDALVRVDDEEVRAIVETVDRSHL